MPDTTETLERGDIFFFYRPKINQKHPDSESDIQRFYMVLCPANKQIYRISVIGQKELPDPKKSGHRRYWGYIGMVSNNAEDIRNELGEEHYQTKTRGERHIWTARPAGEGVYRIVDHNGHTHLIYRLELPKSTGVVQQELNIEEQASFVISIKNPQKGSPPAVGLSSNRNAIYPENLQEKFGNKRFIALNPSDFLDHRGAEFILISASENIKEELGIELHPDDETTCSADVFRELKIDKTMRPLNPLFKGDWQ